MPNPITDQYTGNPDNWMPKSTPGGDVPFEQLFDEGGSQQQTTAQSVATPAPQIAEEPVIRTSRSVYKTMDDAKKGIEEKDTVIEQLRGRLSQIEGADPITHKPVGSQTQQVSYSENPKAYVRDLAKAAREGDEVAYAQVQAKFQADYLSPFAPVLRDMAKNNAIEAVAKEYGNEFRDFRNSPEFERVLEKNPVLKTGVQGAEFTTQFHPQIAGLYKLAYESYLAAKMPELLKSAQQSALPAPAQARPTVSNTMSAPPTPTTAQDVTEMLHSHEGRQELLKRLGHLKDTTWQGRI